ncbi:MAG: ATP-binding protein [Desulfobacteraceae bacterium]|nr:ATP-binding protein [Desulfobacteraceae bacterium]
MPTLKSIFTSPFPDEADFQMEVHPVTLAFIGGCAYLEPTFLEDLQRKALPQQRFAALLTTFFYAAFAWLDAAVAPDLKYQLWFVRFAVVCPSFLAVLLLSYSRRAWPYFQFMMLAGALVGGLGIIYMTMIGNPLIVRTYYAGIMLVLMFLYGFLWLRFVWASLCGWTLIAAYALAVGLTRQLPAEVMTNNAFFGISANLIGMAVGYAIERYRRRDFYMRHLLQTQRRTVEAAKEVLEERISERTTLLAQANEELRREIEAHQRLSWEKQMLEGQLRHAQKMEAIGTLAGGIAHDFNNILAAIMGQTELALMQITNKKEAEQCLSEVINASLRAKDLVGQILAFSRQSESELKPLQISLVVKEAMRLIRATLPASIAIRQRILAVESIVVADATQIHQIVINLCTNAAHAMEGASGTLEISLMEEEVQAQTTQDSGASSAMQPEPGQYVCLSVSDTGHGIPEYLLERIFDPYFTTKAKGVGTGLGLAVVRGIVQNHGGFIQVKSTPGQGTTFRVYLPLVQGYLKPDDQAFLHTLTKGNEHILLVDDEEGLAELGARLLTTLGYRVAAFTSAQLAVEEFRTHPEDFDLVITDMVMPHMNGEQLAREILALRPQMPIIVYTGFTNIVATEKIKQMGVRAVLRKPITIQGLSQTIRKVLRERGAGPPQKD